MSTADDELTKVHVDLPNHWGTTGEALWARALGGDRYEIRHAPFYAYDLNLRDVVEAQQASPELKPSVLRVLERSGHRTMRVFFQDGVQEDEILWRLHSMRDLHVSCERCSMRYVALDLEPDASSDAVRHRPDAWTQEGVLEYETCEAR